MTGLRERKIRKTRESILRVALELFARKGFDETSIEEIAAAAEVAPRTFYRYFPTKEALVFLDQDAEDAALARELKIRAKGESNFDVLVRALRAAYSVSQSDAQFSAQLYELVQQHPVLQARAMQLALRWENLITAGLLASMNRQGKSKRAALDARVLAASAIAALRVAITAWSEAGRRGSPERYVMSALVRLRDGFGKS